MTPEYAGRLCDRLDDSLRGSESNLHSLASSLVVVLREEAWRERRIRTGEVVHCASFLELLTTPPLHGFGEDPTRVEALLRDDAEALRMFRAATTAPKHVHKTDGDNVTITPRRGHSRAYALTRLQKTAPALYAQVVAGELSAHAAAVKAGLRKTKTPLEQLRYWWARASTSERRAFAREIAK